MNDEANPQGMPRPRLATRNGGSYPQEGARKRPMLPIQGRGRRLGAGIGIDGKPWGTMAKDSDPTPAQGIERPKLPVGKKERPTISFDPNMPAVTPAPSTAQRPRPTLKLKTMDEIYGD